MSPFCPHLILAFFLLPPLFSTYTTYLPTYLLVIGRLTPCTCPSLIGIGGRRCGLRKRCRDPESS
ncbi:hypothetical protein LY76DRAFT_595356 [Colletotrichum caudatum]|nr:hypothetical protein LY76DRAFT_595356 [Colletotrichum caudatum]